MYEPKSLADCLSSFLSWKCVLGFLLLNKLWQLNFAFTGGQCLQKRELFQERKCAAFWCDNNLVEVLMVPFPWKSFKGVLHVHYHGAPFTELTYLTNGQGNSSFKLHSNGICMDLLVSGRTMESTHTHKKLHCGWDFGSIVSACNSKPSQSSGPDGFLWLVQVPQLT